MKKLFIFLVAAFHFQLQAQDLPVGGQQRESRHMYSCEVVVKSGDGRSDRNGTLDRGLDERMLFVAMEYAIAIIFNFEICSSLTFCFNFF